MLSLIFGRGRAESLPVDKPPPLIAMIAERSIAFSSVWQNASSMKLIKKVLDVSRLSKDHPFYQEAMRRFKTLYPGQKTASSFSQENLKIQEVINDIKQNGSRYAELILNDVNDELLEAIASFCVNLNTLVIKQREGYSSLSDKGLLALSKLSKLTSFTLDGIFSHLSEEGLKSLLSSRVFVSQVSELALHLLQITDAVYCVITAYKNLNYLSLHSYYLTPAIATFIPPITLKGFKLEQKEGFAPSPFSGLLVSLLADCNLTTLSLKGEAQIPEDVLVAFFSKQKMLLALEFDLQPLTPKILESIPANIFRLSLSKLESITDFNPLFTNQNKLIELQLHQAAHLTSEDLSNLKAPVKSLFLDAPRLRSIPEISTVEALTIKNNSLIESETFTKLNELTSLTSLSVIDCPRFDSNVLESFSKSSLKHQLKRIELDGVGVMDLMPLTEFGNLRSIALRKCFNVNATRLCDFLSSLSLQTTVKGLYLDSLVLKKIHLMLLCEFGYLTILYLGNPDYLSEAEKEDALKLPNLLTNNAIVYIWEGSSRLGHYREAFGLVKEGTNPK